MTSQQIQDLIFLSQHGCGERKCDDCMWQRASYYGGIDCYLQENSTAGENDHYRDIRKLICGVAKRIIREQIL